MRLILLFLILLNISFATTIKNVYILKDSPTLNFENIKTNQNFKRTKKHIQRNTEDEYWIKLELGTTNIQVDKQYLLKVNSRFKINTIVFDDSLKKDILDKNTVELNNIKTVYLKIENKNEYVDVNFDIYEKDKLYDQILAKKILFGIAYGIIFSAFLYYLAFYIFNRQKSFIYYSFTQMTMLIMLLDIDTIQDYGILGFLIFSNLFTKEFLNTKKYTPKLNNLLTFMIYFYLIDTIFENIFSNYFPVSIFLIVYIFTAIIVYKQTKSKPVLFYIAGWSIVIFSFMFIDSQFYFSEFLKTEIPFHVVMHIIAPLESLILAFSLSYKMKLLEEEKLHAERAMIHQNKLAAMGEMISNIAHQWRQPLTHLSYIFMNINTAFKHNKLDKSYLENKSQEATNQLEYMSNTIDDFRNFYTPQKEKSNFQIHQEISKALNIVSSTLESNNIEINIQGDDFFIEGYESEFSQVILNLITNAKDALINNNIQNPSITISLEKNSIQIIDNAGGIPSKILSKIFEPYFTTKEKGSGLGLYMSKVIIEDHFNGTLLHENINNGSCFYIKL